MQSPGFLLSWEIKPLIRQVRLRRLETAVTVETPEIVETPGIAETPETAKTTESSEAADTPETAENLRHLKQRFTREQM